MKLVLAIVSNEDASKVIKTLIKEGFFVTKLATTGGFLMSGNTTILVGAGPNAEQQSRWLPGTGLYHDLVLETATSGDAGYVASASAATRGSSPTNFS